MYWSLDSVFWWKCNFFFFYDLMSLNSKCIWKWNKWIKAVFYPSFSLQCWKCTANWRSNWRQKGTEIIYFPNNKITLGLKECFFCCCCFYLKLLPLCSADAPLPQHRIVGTDDLRLFWLNITGFSRFICRQTYREPGNLVVGYRTGSWVYWDFAGESGLI